MRWVLYLSLFVTVTTAATCLISIVIPYWLYARDPQLSYQGLWQRCYPLANIGDPSKCEVIILPPEFLDAVRCLMIVAFLLNITAAICAFLFTCVKKEKISLINAALFLMLIGGTVFVCVANAVYLSFLWIIIKVKFLNFHSAMIMSKKKNSLRWLTCMSGVIVYGTLYEKLLKAKGLNLHAGFALAVCSAILAFLNTVLYCVAKVIGEVE